MIRLGKMADYGLLVTNEIIKGSVELKKTEDIARKVKLPITTVRKILQHLVDAQLVESFRGVNGGYRLARPPEKIKIADVITAIEGPIAITECSVADKHCNLEETCSMKENWSFINFIVDQILKQISLADMATTLQLYAHDFSLLKLLTEKEKVDCPIPSH